jgi:hypothetical protein
MSDVERKASCTEQFVGGVEFQVLNTEQSVTRGDPRPARAPSGGSGAICKRREGLSGGRRVKSVANTGHTMRSAEQSA